MRCIFFGWSTAGEIRHPGIHEFLRLAIDQHEHLAGKWADANWGPGIIFPAVLSNDKSSLKGDAFLPATVESEMAGLRFFGPITVMKTSFVFVTKRRE